MVSYVCQELQAVTVNPQGRYSFKPFPSAHMCCVQEEERELRAYGLIKSLEYHLSSKITGSGSLMGGRGERQMAVSLHQYLHQVLIREKQSLSHWPATGAQTFRGPTWKDQGRHLALLGRGIRSYFERSNLSPCLQLIGGCFIAIRGAAPLAPAEGLTKSRLGTPAPELCWMQGLHQCEGKWCCSWVPRAWPLAAALRDA